MKIFATFWLLCVLKITDYIWYSLGEWCCIIQFTFPKVIVFLYFFFVFFALFCFFVYLFFIFAFLKLFGCSKANFGTLARRVGSLSIDTSFWPFFIFPLRSHRKTLSEVLGKLTLRQVVLEIETFRFLVQHLNPLSHSLKSQCNSVVRKGIFLEWYGSESFFFLFVKWLIF